MIAAWTLVAALWSALVMAFDLTGLFLPDFGLAVAAWAGMRAFRHAQDVNLVIVVGLTQGLFRIDPWLLPPFLGLVTLVLVQAGNRSLAPRSLFGRGMLAFAALLVLVLLELVLRMSVPSLNLRPGLVFGLTARAAASALLAVVFDGLAPRRS